jgi:hypothetical protein
VIRGRPALLVAFLAVPAGCADLIAIEDASVDPLLGRGGGDAGAGTSASGGGAPGAVATTSASTGDAAGSSAGGGGEGGGAGGDAATAATGGGGGAGGGAPGPAVCEAYCELVMSNCTGAFAVYASIDVCRATCPLLPEGEPGDTSGNTVRCRMHQAEAAPAEPSFYCPNASMGGNGVCGTNCEGLCAVAPGVCTGDMAPWPSGAACLAACAELPDLGTFSTDGAAGMYAGPHVQCRLFHLAAASVDAPEVHCTHVAGAPPCAAD